MQIETRRAASELAYAWADVQRALAQYEIEDSLAVAAQVAQRLNMLAIRANDVKEALRAEQRARVAA